MHEGDKGEMQVKGGVWMDTLVEKIEFWIEVMKVLKEVKMVEIEVLMEVMEKTKELKV